MSAISRLRAALDAVDSRPVELSLPRPKASQTTLDGLRYVPSQGYWVPADSRVDQVAGAYAANLDIGTSYMFGGRGGGLFGWSALLSCVRLLSGVCAQLITTPGSLNVRKITDGKTQRGGRHLAIREWLANAPDGRDSPAYNFWSDFTADLLLGNALAYRDGRDRLRRLRASTAEVDDSSGAYIYRAEPVGAGEYGSIDLPRRRVIHARWPQVTGKQSVREDLFSSAPVIALRANTLIGQKLDAYIRYRFGPGAWKSGAVISQDFLSGTAGAGGSTKFIDLAAKWADTAGREFAFPGKVGAMLLEPKMAEMQAREHRAAQVKDAGRIFGIPAHMLGEEAGAMAASGIEQMSRVFWRTSAKSFVMAILSALSARLLPRSEQFVIDESEFLRGDAAATATLLTAIYQGANMIGPDGAPAEPDLNRNERRHLLGAPADDEIGPGGEPKTERPPNIKPPPERLI